MQVNDRVRIELKQQVTPFLTNDSRHSTTHDLQRSIRFLTLSRFSRSGQVYVPSSPEDASLSIGAAWQIRPPSRRAGLQYACTAPWQAAKAPLKQCMALARHGAAPCSRCCLVCGCEAHCQGALHAVCRRTRDVVPLSHVTCCATSARCRVRSAQSVPSSLCMAARSPPV